MTDHNLFVFFAAALAVLAAASITSAITSARYLLRTRRPPARWIEDEATDPRTWPPFIHDLTAAHNAVAAPPAPAPPAAAHFERQRPTPAPAPPAEAAAQLAAELVQVDHPTRAGRQWIRRGSEVHRAMDRPPTFEDAQ